MPKHLSSANLTAGDRLLIVSRDRVTVHTNDGRVAGWVTWPVWSAPVPKVKGTTYTTAFPAELAALIHDVLHAEAPLQPLVDWVIEYGPAELAAELEAMNAAAVA